MKKAGLYFSILFFLALWTYNCQAQNPNSVQKEYEFVKYLLGNNLKSDADTWAQRDFSSKEYSLQEKDSLLFLKGWVFYSNRELDKALEHFDSISLSSNLYSPAKYLSSVQNLYLDNLEQAKRNINSIEDTSVFCKELSSFTLSGIALMERDYNSFNNLKKDFSYENIYLTNHEKALDSIYNRISNYKKKSPFLAGTLSAVIPGLGKIYAGEIGEGVGAFLTVGSFAAICAENWIHHGITNWKTIGAGLVSTVFYIGNIYGSAVSVKLKYEEFNKKQNVEILYNIHIPIRNTFRP